jgi:N-acyl-D-aspartate/D-glutamate deacylase
MLAIALVAVWTSWPGVLTGQEPGATAEYDVVIRNGRVLDGSGNPWFRADVGLRGDRVAVVGDLSDARGREEVDATGLFVAPGFIDVHTHTGPGLETPELSDGRPLLAQGITTAFVNPDGGGYVDLAAQRDSLLLHGLGVNVAQMVPHGSVRREVLGMQDRKAGPAELERMKALVRAGMEQGAFGLSSGPFYTPGSYSDTRELVELARVAAEYGGAYASHIRDESNYTIGVVAAVDEVITVAREGGLPGVVTHIKVLGPPVWGYSSALVHRIEEARRRGTEVYADQYPYVASATGLQSALLPRWAQAGGGDSLRARLQRPDDRARIREAMEANLARRGGADRIQFRRFEEDPAIEGRTLAEVARERNLHPLDAALAMFEQGGPSIVSFNMHEDDVRTLMVQPWTMTSSDGGLVPMGEGVPHPRNYGAFARKIRVYVQEEGVLGLEQAIRSMTSLPAQVFRVADRGLLRPGAYADVTVFDLDRVRDVGTFTDPHHLAEGTVHVWVNGERAVADERFTGTRAGRVLRRDEAPAGVTVPRSGPVR